MGKGNLKVDTIKKLDEKDLKDVSVKETKNKIVESIKETVYGKDRVRIILIMMIKNESKIIERALESVSDFVDGIVVCDTGSTDETVSIVNTYFKTLKIPTKLYKHKWQNFGHNRSLSFTETVSFCKSLKWPLDKTYGLLLDADQELNVDEDLFDRQDLIESGYNLLLKTSYNIFYVPKLINLGKKWRCVGATHEYWEDPEDEKGPMDIDEDEMYIDDIGDGGCKSDKYERDIRLLTEELKNPINESRTIYYLGQSYFDLDQHEEAIKWFEKRIEYTLNKKNVDDKYDNTCEVYQAYLKIALSKKELDKPEIEVRNSFMKCIELYPTMLEPIYYLMKYYMDLENWKEAFEIGKLGLDIEIDDEFITEYQIYEHLYKDDMLVVCLENKKYGIGVKLGLSLLKERKFDREDKKRIKDNYKLCLEYLYMNDLENETNYKYQIMEKLKSFNNSNMEDENTIILICVIKNEYLLLDYFIKHYTKIGVTHFIFIDNGSLDDTHKYLLDHETNIMLLKTEESFKLHKANWITAMLDKYCKNKWSVVVDSDEIIYVDNLSELKNNMIKTNTNVCNFYLLDMYPKNYDNEYKKGKDFLSHSNYYDKESDINKDFYSGVRKRTMNVSACLYKISFFKYEFECCNKIVTGHHCLFNFADHDCVKYYEKTQFLLHFKFIKPELKKFFSECVNNNQYWNNSIEYKNYLNSKHYNFYDPEISLCINDIKPNFSFIHFIEGINNS